MNTSINCPELSQTGWLLFSIFIVDGLVRLRKLYLHNELEEEKDFTNWNETIRQVIQRANKRQPNSIISDDQLKQLQSFFDEL